MKFCIENWYRDCELILAETVCYMHMNKDRFNKRNYRHIFHTVGGIRFGYHKYQQPIEIGGPLDLNRKWNLKPGQLLKWQGHFYRIGKDKRIESRRVFFDGHGIVHY